MAANSQGICNTYKLNALNGVLTLAANTDSLKAALYFQNSGIGPTVSAYTTIGEVGGTNYTPGGIAVPNATGTQISGSTTYWTPSNALIWPNLTIGSPFDCVLIYDASRSNVSIAVFTFTPQTISATTFTINMPANVSTSALIQLN